MNKNAIKKFATEARQELISRVGQRALRYGISDKEVGNPNDDSVGGHLLSSTEKKQRAALIGQIKEKGYEQVMEEVAYTWFNRFSALRFMEVNGYLPTRVRVFTDENNAFKPQILTEAIHMELDGLDMEKVYAYKEANDDDELYKYLLITQCNALNSVLPGMFQKIADYTELLFPDNLLREGSVVQQMIDLIPEEDWKDAVQIIGWLYQYYNIETFDSIYDGDMSRSKVTKSLLPAATELFTPDWVVRYMVENSLGRLWMEGHPNDELKSQWKYYLKEVEQESDVQMQLASIREERKALKPEDILCIDPCAGSGHILAYMFDVLVQIYEAYGVDTRTAVASIVENNIYGLDIDDRAAQLAYFSVMMKACQYDKEENKTYFVLGFLMSSVCNELLKLLNPTINYQAGNIKSLPVLFYNKEDVEKCVRENVIEAKSDWDSFETSWDFQRHPLLRKVSTIAESFEQWQSECDNRFNKLKANEEELNRIFIDIYGLQDELTPEVEDKDVTVRKADLGRDIRSFISYAVGCMFGRYSMDVDGLAYAGGEWADSKYSTFKADEDNIIPISDDEYFEDDIIGRFVKFVEVVYGKDTLQENLKFIADALGGKEQPKDVIRNYFMNGFYADHCKIYQKRPIYWLFDSGKKNGFKCLIYMHRYQPDTIARIRTDYVHEQQAR